MKKLLIPFFVLIFSVQIFAQLEDRFQSLLDTDLENFAQPLATSIGVGFNSGNYHDAYVSKLFGFSIGVKAMMMFVPDDQLTFTPEGLPEYYSSDKETATIFGGKGTAYSGPAGYLTYPAGIDNNMFPLVTPQASVSAFGTELMIRFLPEIQVGDENLTLFGFGLKHSISQYIPLLPVDIAVQYTNNSLSITNLLDVTSSAFNVHASRSFALVTVYGGLQYETSSLELEYTYKDENGTSPELDGEVLKLNFEDESSMRVTAGVALNLAFMVLNADYSIGAQNVASFGLSFGM
ncbi:MAG: hypothetical protein GY936_15530 [Ignavibacteriae bacterium]|nr:hypothetical protein [Ignavibacteriota bacterium]